MRAVTVRILASDPGSREGAIFPLGRRPSGYDRIARSVVAGATIACAAGRPARGGASGAVAA